MSVVEPRCSTTTMMLVVARVQTLQLPVETHRGRQHVLLQHLLRLSRTLQTGTTQKKKEMMRRLSD